MLPKCSFSAAEEGQFAHSTGALLSRTAGYHVMGWIILRRVVFHAIKVSARRSTMTYRLSQVQSTQDDRRAFAGVGFNILNERGAPIVTFGYLDQSKATNARTLIEKAIVDAALIAAAGR
jgi:hypothetical protein